MAKTPTYLQAAISCLYLDLRNQIETLKGEGVLKQVGRWNNQLATEVKTYSTILPACWIELLPIDWQYNNNSVPRGPITFRLHSCRQAHKGDFEFEDWEQNQKIHEKVQGFETPISSAFRLVRTIPEHNYDVWIDNKLDYTTFVTDESLLRLRNTGTISTLGLTIDGDPDIPD